jgi:hypothetical protein
VDPSPLSIFSPFPASRPLFLTFLNPCCTPTSHVHHFSRALLVSLPVSLTHTEFSLMFPCLQVAKLALFRAMCSHFSLVSYWFALLLRESQSERTGWLASVLLTYTVLWLWLDTQSALLAPFFMLASSSTLTMMAVCFPETSVDFHQTTWRFITDDTTFNIIPSVTSHFLFKALRKTLPLVIRKEMRSCRVVRRQPDTCGRTYRFNLQSRRVVQTRNHQKQVESEARGHFFP